MSTCLFCGDNGNALCERCLCCAGDCCHCSPAERKYHYGRAGEKVWRDPVCVDCGAPAVAWLEAGCCQGCGNDYCLEHLREAAPHYGEGLI